MSKHDEWETPPDLFRRLHHEFSFDLDAAASATNHKLPRFITAEEDALKTPWNGRAVWCNPPYSRLKEFTEMAVEQGDVFHNTIVLLVPAYTDTQWWLHNVTQAADEVRFLVGRLRFWENGQQGKDTARFPSAVVIYRPTPQGMQLSSLHINWWDWRRDNG